MGSVPDEGTILSAARPLVAAGVAVHWLHRRSKRPVGDEWQKAPVHDFESLKAAYRSGYNLGVRPGEFSKTAAGYLHLIDLDIRKPEFADEAWACLLAIWPEARDAPFVISGSGGESRHIYLFTDKPFRSVNFGKSEGREMVFDPKKGRDVQKWDWECGLYGAPKQAVLPPSIHPDSGLPYVWGREIDWDLVEMGIGPVVDSSIVATWGAREDDLDMDDEDADLMSMVRAAPMGLSEDEIDRILADIPNDDLHHDDYVQVGMALSHEYEGSQVGFEKWCEWAKQSDKFDIRTQKTKWKSFKGRANPVRMASLIAIAGRNRLEQAHADLDDLLGGDETDENSEIPEQSRALTVVRNDTDLDDLLGPSSIATDDDLADLLGTTQPITPGATGRPVLNYDPDWRSHFHRNEEGDLKTTLHNARLIMRNDARIRGAIAINQFTQEVVLVKQPGRRKLNKESPKPIVQLDSPIWSVKNKINGDLWTDSHSAGVRAVIEAPDRQGGYGIKISQRDLNDALDIVAQENGFHPVRDYLNGLHWDGVHRATSLFIDYVGSPDDAYHREAAMLWLMGAVTRVFEPGHKFDFVPILKGLQGKRKSTFFRILAKDWFAELEGDFHNTQEMVEKMQGAWLLEIPELSAFSKAEVTVVKGFISRQTDKVRLAYARRAQPFDRQCVFGGTTNEDEPLRDSTGGRRFWPVECYVSEIDTDRLSENIDQIWAETVVMYRAWRERYGLEATLPLYMKNDAADIAKQLQEAHRQQGSDDVLAARIEEWLLQPIGSELGLEDLEGEEPRYRDIVCLLEVWEQMMGRDINTFPERDQQLLGRAIRKVEGWGPAGGRRQFGPRYGRQRAYKKFD